MNAILFLLVAIFFDIHLHDWIQSWEIGWLFKLIILVFAQSIALGLFFFVCLTPSGPNVNESPYFRSACVLTIPFFLLILCWEMGIPPRTSLLFFIVCFVICGLSSWLVFLNAPINFKIASFVIFLSLGFVIFVYIESILQAKKDISLLRAAIKVPEVLECPQPNTNSLFVHFSDTHIVESVTLGARQPETIPGNQILPKFLSEIKKFNPKFALVSGDITDEGTSSQWKTALSIFQSASFNISIILAPGNHDLHEFFEPKHDIINKTVPKLRLGRFLKAQKALYPKLLTAKGVPIGGVDLDFLENTSQYRGAREVTNLCLRACLEESGQLKTWTDYERDRNTQLPVFPKFDKQKGWDCYSQCSKSLPHDFDLKRNFEKSAKEWEKLSEEVFPLHEIDSSQSLAVFSLLGGKPDGSTALGTNALGYLQHEQVDRLKQLLEKMERDIQTIVILYHYPLTLPPEEIRNCNLFDWRCFFHTEGAWFNYMFLRHEPLGASRLIETLVNFSEDFPDRNIIVSYGHRHKRSFGKIGNVLLVEAPEVGSKQGGGFYLFNNTPSLQISWCPNR